MPTPGLARSSRRSTILARLGFLGAVATGGILAGPIQAANINWDNSSADLLWTTNTNWSTDTLPTAADIAVMNVAATQTISLNGSTQTILGILFNQGQAYTINNGSLILNQLNQTGNAGNTISAAVGITTFNGGTDVLTSNVTQNTLQAQGQVIAGGIVKTGNGVLRLGTSGTAYNGGITGDLIINGGTLQVSAANVSGVNNPMATDAATAGTIGATNADVIIGAAGVTFSTTHSNLASAGGAGTYDWGRDVIANNNSFTWNVDRAAGLANSGTAQLGVLTIGNATMTLTGNNGFSGRLDGINVLSGSTAILGINNNSGGAQNLTVDGLSGGGAGSILRKTGGQTLTFTPSAGTYSGDIEHTGGTMNIQAAAGLVPTANAGNILLTNAVTLNLRSNDSVDFNAGLRFDNVKNQAISLDRVSGATTGMLFRVGVIDLSPSATLGERNISINTANGITFAADGITAGAGNATFTTNTDTTADGLTTAAGTIFTKRGNSNLTLTTNNLATSAGTLDIRAGNLTGNVVGAFGTGTVLVGNTVPASSGFFNDLSRVNWGAQGAGQASSGPDVIVRKGGVLDLNVVPAGTDVFDVQTLGRIQGSTTQLQALTVGGNLTIANDAMIVHENPSSTAGNTVSGLANDKSLWYGIAANATSLPTIGAGTPWKGISGENTAGRTIQGANGTTPAIINIAGGDNDSSTVEAYFTSLADASLNIGAAGLPVTWTSTAAGGEKVTLGVRGDLGTSALGLVPGGRVLLQLSASSTGLNTAVDKIIVENGALGVIAANGLGGVPVEVRANGSLDIGNVNGNVLDGNVVIKSGGVLYLNDNQVLGSAVATDEGTITIEGGGKLDITGGAPATIFTGSAANGQPITFTGTGHTVRFAASNITDLDTTVPDAGVTFVVAGGATAATVAETNLSVTTNTQTSGLTLLNGTLTNDATSRAFAGPLTLNDTNLTLAATRGTSLVVTSAVTTAGDIQVGSLTPIDGRDKSNNSAATNFAGIVDPYNSGAQVVVTGAFSANNVTVTNSHFALHNTDSTINGDLSISGGILYLDGGGPAGGTQGQLTPKLLAGTLADHIVLGQYARIEMKLNQGSSGARLDINQPFVLTGDINPVDNRSMWVSRNSGTDTGVNFNDITLMAGSTLGIQEDNSDVRVSLKLAGNATHSTSSSNNNVDYLNVTRDASLPAFDGSNPVVLQQGRLNINGWQGSNSTNTNVFGTIGAGTQIDIVRGQIFFQPGSTLNGVVRTQTAAVGGDSFALVTSNGALTDSLIGGTGRIELGRSGAANGPEDFEIRGTEIASGVTPLTTFGATVRVVNDGVNNNIDGVIRSQRHNDNTVTARTALTSVELAAGSTAQFAPQNGVPLAVGTVTLLGDATIDNATTGTTYNTINAGSNTLTLQGAVAPVITNPVTAGNLVVNGITTTVSLANVTGNLSVGPNPGGTAGSGTAGTSAIVTGTGNVAGAVIVNSSTANLSGNIANGVTLTTGVLNLTGVGTKTVGGPVSLDGGSINVSGVVDFGSTVITATAPATVAGLREQRSAGAFDLTTVNSSNVVKLGPVMAQSTTGWGTNETYTYTGQFFVPDNNGDGTGSFSFAENFDDSVRLAIDGVQRLNNGVYNAPTGTGVLTLAAGWHDFEARFGQAGGGAGPNTVATGAWDASLGFGVDLTLAIDGSTTAPTRANFVAPLDNGSMNLFRTTVQSNITLAASSAASAGGVTNLGALTYSGSNAAFTLVSNGSANAGSIASLAISGASSSNTLEIAEASDSLTIGSLNLGTAANALNVSGDGNLIVTGTGTGTGGLVLNGVGTLTVTGSITGSTQMNGGIITGTGVLGDLNAGAGIIAPGLSTGILTTGSLLAGNAAFEFDLAGGASAGSALAGLNYDQIVVNGSAFDLGSSTLSLSAVGAFFTNDVFNIIRNNGAGITTGFFSGLDNGDTYSFPNGYEVQISYFDDASTPQFELAGGNDVSLLVTVPEPGSAALLLGGLGSLMALRRRRRAKA